MGVENSGARWNQRELQASLESNYDNPVSSTHQALSHQLMTSVEKRLDIYQDEGGLGAKTGKATSPAGNMSKMIDFCKSNVKLLKPC